jgi:hypothetical protein
MDERKAIQMGRERMKISKDPIHGFEHAKNVEKYSLEIFQSLKKEGWEMDSEIDENLILLCAWWHDCYKALFEKKTLLNEFFEGIRSAEIAQEELKGFVSEKRLKMILDAIRVHNNFLFLFFSGKKLPILTRILIEADTIDSKNIERKKKRNSSPRSLFHKVMIFFAEPVVSFFQSVYIKSPYAKCHLNSMNNKKKQ